MLLAATVDQKLPARRAQGTQWCRICGEQSKLIAGYCSRCYSRRHWDKRYFAGLRVQVLARDNHSCQFCSKAARGKRSIAVHHRRPGTSTLASLISLRPGCHARLHKIFSGGKTCFAVFRMPSPCGANFIPEPRNNWRLVSMVQTSSRISQPDDLARSSWPLADLALFRPSVETGNALTEAALLSLVLDGMTSKHSRRAYGKGLTDFFAWIRSTYREETPGFTKALVQEYRAALLERGLSASTINLRLSALRKLAREVVSQSRRQPGALAVLYETGDR